MENVLQTFVHEEFGKIRTLILDNEPWFIDVDAASALLYRDPTGAIRKNVDDEDKKIIDWNTALKEQGISDAGSDNGWIKNEVVIINESGLYSLIMRSRLPRAKEFKRWVTAVVLPALRKYGYYAMGESADKLAELEKKNAALEKEKFSLEAENAALKEKLAAAEEMTLERIDTMVTEAAVALKHTYVFEMGNNTVKIGVTKDTRQRISHIVSKTRIQIIRHYETALVDSKIAYEIERRCHATFADRRVEGEYFKVPFEEVVAELKKYDPKTGEFYAKLSVAPPSG